MTDTQTATNPTTDLLCSSCRGKGEYPGTDITCRSCHGSGVETDLVKIAKWEVIQAAKTEAAETRRLLKGNLPPSVLMTPSLKNLLAAVSLLESRELAANPAPENVPSVHSEPDIPRFGSAAGKVEMATNFDAELVLSEPNKLRWLVNHGNGWQVEVEAKTKDGGVIVFTGRPEVTFRIEKRGEDGAPTEYWNNLACFGGWVTVLQNATVYTESERVEIMNKATRGEPCGFPSGGIWCRVESREAKEER